MSLNLTSKQTTIKLGPHRGEEIVAFPTYAYLYDSKGEILLLQGKNQEALEMWRKVMELNPDFLKDYPDGTGLSNGLKELGLIK